MTTRAPSREVLDPEKSLVAEETAFASLPCQEVNPDHCALVQPFGTWINNASENKEAAWLLVQFLTSKDVQARAAQAGALLTPSRLSVLSDPATVAALPATFPEALTHILQHPNVTLLPFIPEGVAIIPPIQLGLQELITTDKPVADVMADMGAGIQAIMTDAGLSQAVPGVLGRPDRRVPSGCGERSRERTSRGPRAEQARGPLSWRPDRAVLPPGGLVAGPGRDAGGHGHPLRDHPGARVHEL